MLVNTIQTIVEAELVPEICRMPVRPLKVACRVQYQKMKESQSLVDQGQDGTFGSDGVITTVIKVLRLRHATYIEVATVIR